MLITRNVPRLMCATLAALTLLLGRAVPAHAQEASGDLMQDNVIVILDASGSMKDRMAGMPQSKMEAAKSALISSLSSAPETTNIGVVVFSGLGVPEPWVYPLGPLDRPRLAAAINRPQPKGKTPLGRYLKIAADRLLEQREQQLGYGSYRLLVVTDGEANDPELVNRYLPDILARGLVVDVIGVDMAGDHALATRVHSYRRADDPETLVRAVAEVFAEVRPTTDDATSEDNFALLASLPDQMASAMITALSRSGNDPIGSNRSAASSSMTLPGRPVDQNSQPSGTAPSVPSSGSTILFVMFAIIVIGAVVLPIFITIARRIGG